MPVKELNYSLWLFRLITWDGLLPGCVVLVPIVIGFLFPNNRGPIELAAVVLPSAGFFIRIRAGAGHIASNHCSITVRRIQLCAFVLGIFPLVLLECVLMLTHVMPALIMNWTDIAVCAILFAIYLTLMAIAMYPGQVALQQGVEWT